MKQRIADFLINEGLYGEGLQISKDDFKELQLFLEDTYKIEAYCRHCDSERIFTTVDDKSPRRKSVGGPSNQMSIPPSYGIVVDGEEDTSDDDASFNALMEEIAQNNYDSLIKMYPKVQKTFSCAMDERHSLTFSCIIKNNHIIKYGQYPSFADLNVKKSKKYRKILGEKYSDYNTGIGLHSHGIGAGSLVYLRRIFEDLIEEAHKKASNEPGWNEKNYPNRMDEKIQYLKQYLPEYLVENRKIYGLLSKGIHELPEDRCKMIFPIVRVGIEFILDEKMEKEEREKRKKETASLIERLSAQIEN